MQQTMTMTAEPAGTVFVLDDDASVRRSLARLLASAGYRVEALASAEEFLARPLPVEIACIVSDLRMPGLSGLDLQTCLLQEGCDLPIVFISGRADIATSVRAMKAGAVDFLPKPFADDDILSAVAKALARSADSARAHKDVAALNERYSALTQREREVFALVVAGLPNKVSAGQLGTTEKTVKVHRARVMEKMSARSLADLVRMADQLQRPVTIAYGAAPPLS